MIPGSSLSVELAPQVLTGTIKLNGKTRERDILTTLLVQVVSTMVCALYASVVPLGIVLYTPYNFYL